jgi:hypothetical protein
MRPFELAHDAQEEEVVFYFLLRFAASMLRAS